jgi:hypothetical protein
MDVQVMDIATGEVSTVFSGRGMREVMAFFPDGQSLLVRESVRSGNDQDIYRLDIDKSALTPLMPHQGKARYLAARLFKDGSGGVTVCDQDSDFMAIHRFAAEGGSAKPVVELSNHNIEALALSPDQTRIAFLANEDGWSRIGIVDRDGSGLISFEEQPSGVIGSIAFTPDGSSLISAGKRIETADNLEARSWSRSFRGTGGRGCERARYVGLCRSGHRAFRELRRPRHTGLRLHTENTAADRWLPRTVHRTRRPRNAVAAGFSRRRAVPGEPGSYGRGAQCTRQHRLWPDIP